MGGAEKIWATACQYPMMKTLEENGLFGFWNLGDWKLFDISDLIFRISIDQRTSDKVNPLRR